MLDPQASRFGQAAILSGLMDVDSLLACWNAIPPRKREDPEHIDRRLARQAVQSQSLTLWQAQQILAGRTAGFKVDRYVLLELLGQGGMGRVYLARDTRLNRRVALKILAPERINNPRALARFQREARVGAQLQHENLVRVYDFGESSGRNFLVMEFIEGKTIGQLLSEQGPMPAATAARLARQVSHGLAHAHRKGLIHRDVNPYNIMVTHEGVAKLADLGLAIDLAEEDRVTREGATVGTFDYVAPEQARHSHSADIRSDIYSLGCTLYHMISGRVPFPSPSLPEKLFAHQAMDAPPLEQLVPALPAGLAEVVRTMMRKQPDERYATPTQVIQALDPYVEDSGGSYRAAPASDMLAAPEPMAGPDSGVAPDGAAPGAAQPDPERVLAGSAAGAAPMAGVGALSDHGGVTTVAATSTPSSNDLDDPGGRLMTPMDDGAPDGIGLPIRVDLDLDSRLRPPARPRDRGRLSAIFARMNGPESAAGTPPPAPATAGGLRSAWSRLPAGRRAAIVVGGAILALIVLLAPAGWFLLLGGKARSPVGPGGNRDIVKPTAPSGPAPRRAPVIRVRTHGGGAADDDDTPATTLREAVRAAMGRRNYGFVELGDGEPLTIAGADFLDEVSSRGTMDIRAAEGAHPVLDVAMDPGRPFIATGLSVSLMLTGLTVRVRYPAAAGAAPAVPRPVIDAAGRVALDRCAIEVVGPRPDGCRAVVTEGAGLAMKRCWISGFDRAIEVQAYPDTVTRIEQSMIIPGPTTTAGSSSAPELRGWAMGVRLVRAATAKEPPKRRLGIDHCTIEGAGFLSVTGDPGQSPLLVEVSRSLVRAEALLAWTPREEAGSFQADIKWEGRGNHYQVLGDRSWIMKSAGTMTPAESLGVTDLAGWSRFVGGEKDAIDRPIRYLTDPHVRSDPLRPRDFAIEPSGSPAARAGAVPDQVGPW